MSLGVWDTNFAAKKRTRAAAAAAVGRRSGRGCSYGNHLRTKSKCQTSSRTCLSNHRNLLGLLVRILHCWMFQKGMCMIASIRWLIRESVTQLWQLPKWLPDTNVHHPHHPKGPRTGTVEARAAPTERTDSIRPPASTEDLVTREYRRFEMATDQWISQSAVLQQKKWNDM